VHFREEFIRKTSPDIGWEVLGLAARQKVRPGFYAIEAAQANGDMFENGARSLLKGPFLFG